METQQMMELLRVRLNVSMKEQMQQITAEMKADRMAHQARMEDNEDDLPARLIETNRKIDREDLKKMRDEIKSGQAEMRCGAS
jgi:hypothetical protein